MRVALPEPISLLTTLSIETVIKWIIATIVGFWVSLPAAITLLLFFMALDYTTGLIAGAIEKKISSKRASEGILKKVQILLLVTASHLAARAIDIGYDLGSMVATAYSISELISITENCSRSGVWVPKKLLEILERARQLADEVWDGKDRRLVEVKFNGPRKRKSDK